MTAIEKKRDLKPKPKQKMVVLPKGKFFDLYLLRGAKRVYQATMTSYLLEKYRRENSRTVEIEMVKS